MIRRPGDYLSTVVDIMWRIFGATGTGRTRPWRAVVSACATLTTSHTLLLHLYTYTLILQRRKHPLVLQVRDQNNALALAAVDGYSGIVTTSVDASLKVFNPLQGAVSLLLTWTPLLVTSRTSDGDLLHMYCYRRRHGKTDFADFLLSQSSPLCFWTRRLECISVTEPHVVASTPCCAPYRVLLLVDIAATALTAVCQSCSLAIEGAGQHPRLLQTTHKYDRLKFVFGSHPKRVAPRFAQEEHLCIVHHE